MTERMGLLSVNGGRARFTPRTLRAELRPVARKLAAVAVGFAGGWAVLYGALMPFGLGFVLGFAEDCFAPCAAGAALGVLLHSFGALSLRSICLLCALDAAVAVRWMGAKKLAVTALAGCGTLVGVALCFALGGNGGAELVFYSAADALLAAAMGLCLRRFAPEQPGAGMLLVGAAAAAALGSVQLWKLWPGVAVSVLQGAGKSRAGGLRSAGCRPLRGRTGLRPGCGGPFLRDGGRGGAGPGTAHRDGGRLCRRLCHRGALCPTARECLSIPVQCLRGAGGGVGAAGRVAGPGTGRKSRACTHGPAPVQRRRHPAGTGGSEPFFAGRDGQRCLRRPAAPAGGFPLGN